MRGRCVCNWYANTRYANDDADRNANIHRDEYVYPDTDTDEDAHGIAATDPNGNRDANDAD